MEKKIGGSILIRIYIYIAIYIYMHRSNISKWGAHQDDDLQTARIGMLKYFLWYFNNKETAATYITTISRVQYPLVFQQQKWMVQHQKTGLEVDKWIFCFQCQPNLMLHMFLMFIVKSKSIILTGYRCRLPLLLSFQGRILIFGAWPSFVRDIWIGNWSGFIDVCIPIVGWITIPHSSQTWRYHIEFLSKPLISFSFD